jgi:hypothetical protein
MAQLGCDASWAAVAERLAAHFGRVFEREMIPAGVLACS